MTASPRLHKACPRCGQRKRLSADGVLAAVAAGKRPLTTLEIAAKLRTHATDISSRLTKLAKRGLINREYRIGSHNGGGYRYAVWSAIPAQATS